VLPPAPGRDAEVMLDSALGFASSIPWGWTAFGLGFAALAVAAAWTGAYSAAIAFGAGAVICLGAGGLIAQRDAARKAQAAAEADAKESDVARAACLGKLDGWIAVAAEQNQAVENLRRESARRLALAAEARRTGEAAAEARGRAAGALAALSAAPAKDGDESCDAADRAVLEGLR